ncbi:unnamed protein product, partial [Iphiclides podalirius]
MSPIDADALGRRAAESVDNFGVRGVFSGGSKSITARPVSHGNFPPADPAAHTQFTTNELMTVIKRKQSRMRQ